MEELLWYPASMVKICSTTSLATVSSAVTMRCSASTQETSMKTDIRETDDAGLPLCGGAAPALKDEIHVDVQDGYLTVSAEKAQRQGRRGQEGPRSAWSVTRRMFPQLLRRRREARGREGQVRVGVLTVLSRKEGRRKLTSGKIAIEPVNRKACLPQQEKADRLFLSQGGYGSGEIAQASAWNALGLAASMGLSACRELRCADTGSASAQHWTVWIIFENGAAYKTAPDGKVTRYEAGGRRGAAAAMVFDENAPR